ncbi:unnamed protein product [Linum tenue]|uniref:Uncharacterized protein n=1 Tax=Linum tenue TaxID=586396 RepID=A0AAV0Q7N5_9ROSI|nr:unnamed protein product [Linum tenue]
MFALPSLLSRFHYSLTILVSHFISSWLASCSDCNHVRNMHGQGVNQFFDLKDNYFEEALKMRNLLEEFHHDHGIRPPTILGVRKHVFTGRCISSNFSREKDLRYHSHSCDS